MFDGISTNLTCIPYQDGEASVQDLRGQPEDVVALVGATYVSTGGIGETRYPCSTYEVTSTSRLSARKDSLIRCCLALQPPCPWSPHLRMLYNPRDVMVVTVVHDNAPSLM